MVVLYLIILWQFFGGIIWAMLEYSTDILHPSYIYKTLNVNKVGAVFLTILSNIICPAVSIGHWFWLACIRKEEFVRKEDQDDSSNDML